MIEEIIKDIPKVELHLHLDGSVRVSTACSLLGKDVTNEMKVDSESVDLNDYLTKFDVPVSLMQNKENLEKISEELGRDLKQEHVIYAEIRFAPMKHLEEGLSPEEVVESVLRGLEKVDIKINLILCMVRGEKEEVNEQVIRLAKKYLGKGVCAIDLAGAEGLFKTKDYERLFNLARTLNVPFTIHAGEADGVSSIKSALDFGARRIGHGVRVVESEELLDKIIKDKITLEVCPTSNINTSIFKSYKQHNIKKLLEKGVKVTINTDNRTVSDITLNQEYQKLKNQLDFTIEDFLECNMNALEASFISEEEKERLQNILKTGYEKYLK